MSKRFHWRDIYALSYCYRVWGAVALVLITAVLGQRLVDPVTRSAIGVYGADYFDWNIWLIATFGPMWILGTALVFPRSSRIASGVFIVTILATIPLSLLAIRHLFIDPYSYLTGNPKYHLDFGPGVFLPLVSVAVAICGGVFGRFCASRPGWKTISRTKRLIATALIIYVLSLPFILMGADAWMTWLRSATGNTIRFSHLAPLFLTMLPVGFSSLGKGFWQAAGFLVLGYIVAFPIIGSLMAVQPDTNLSRAIQFNIVASTLTQLLVYSGTRVSEPGTASDWLRAVATIMLFAIAVVLFDQFFDFFYRR